MPEKPPGQVPAENEIILSVRDLIVHYKRSLSLFSSSQEIIRAVDHVSLDVRKGETLGARW